MSSNSTHTEYVVHSMEFQRGLMSSSALLFEKNNPDDVKVRRFERSLRLGARKGLMKAAVELYYGKCSVNLPMLATRNLDILG